MARNIDLTNVLTNERPTITINGKTYPINDEKTNILLMNNEMKKAGGNELEMVDKIISLLLGKKALKEIDSLGLGLSQYITIFHALVAAVNDEDIEEVKARFQGK